MKLTLKLSSRILMAFGAVTVALWALGLILVAVG